MIETANPNPVGLIRAVNHLRSLGHRDAIEVLNRFAESGLFSQCSDKFEAVVPLLFLRKSAGDKLPLPYFNEAIGVYDLKLDDWQSKFEIYDGIPLNAKCVSFSGFASDKTHLIQWAKERGRICEDYLTPTDDPFSTADKLIQEVSQEYSEEVEDIRENRLLNDRSWVRLQVIRMLEHLIPTSEKSDLNDWTWNDKDWIKLQSICRQRGLKWDTWSQEYRFTK